MKQRRNISNNQDGMVSIVVTMILLIVLTLVVTGFAQLARREQREALDRQLSSQASYAAESGINVAREMVKLNPNTQKTTCPTTNSTLATGIEFSCLLINPFVPEVKLQNVGQNQSTVIPFNAEDITKTPPEPTQVGDLLISWQKSDGGTAINDPFPGLVSSTAWGNNVSILRVDVIPFTAPLDPDAILSGTFTVFLYPGPGSATGDVAYTSAMSGKGGLSAAKCASGGGSSLLFCKARITGLTGSSYYLRFRSIYGLSDVVACVAQNINTCSTNKYVGGSQAEIDATGKAQDVLKRIQVRVPIPNSVPDTLNTPNYALDSGEDICKQLVTGPAPNVVTTDSCP